ncbi:MAG: hypothetical protein AABX65_03780 [Nanoarchaeota archaeon]
MGVGAKVIINERTFKTSKGIKIKFSKDDNILFCTSPPYELDSLITSFYRKNDIRKQGERIETSRGIISQHERGTLLFYMEKDGSGLMHPSREIGGNGLHKCYVCTYNAEGSIDGRLVHLKAEYRASQRFVDDRERRDYRPDGKVSRGTIRQDSFPYWFVTNPKAGSGGR